MIIACRPMMDRDERRWLKADGDGDGQLTKAEFQAFLHPEDHYNMVDIVVLETLEDMDKDSDGAISEQEYIGDIYKVRLLTFVKSYVVDKISQSRRSALPGRAFTRS